MPESKRLVDLVQSRIDEYLMSREPIVTLISSDLAPLIDYSRQFLSGGKRFRAQFCYWGTQSILAPDSRPEPGQPTVSASSDSAVDRGGASAALAPPATGLTAGPEAVVSAASALEIFHAAALVHDDIIDNSDTRRGAPSAHKLFERLHENEGWAGDPVSFGRASAILLGDLLLGWSDELLDEALYDLTDRVSARRARLEFNHMRTEVIAGQYLDILEERAWLAQPEAELLDRALRVIVYKSAKYSVQAPLVIGAALAGATDAQLNALRAFGLPLGMAYQLRDDLLGVFGDAAVTGKPSGDDLTEGKRTVLIALARERLDDADRASLDAQLGDPTLDAGSIAALQRLITASGAVDRVETLIESQVAEAIASLRFAPISAEARQNLLDLTERVTRRAF
ncbi:polyprenyl synthetase family protein [Cryobacterium sp. TMT1-3]|uniref:Polyprenyl synthetase family protein n=1 Tax=Cryobacterium luteum TaxID=1424661 RepID=A0A1H8GS15_9MICO|nr:MULTISPECIES: polyprenyl synthetase family protein [Cryobacterium]TFB84610.1 polyprenyl synthetase family protein [Cryobacterium luteum]TFC28441.1 polyprenyl synthetase family protein [Cryobacterium sp. TMT1-3]SEN46793.1 geranylgeranyl diphosphate synthase, type I [Cryobacterium luteum]